MKKPAKILVASATDWPFPARLAGALIALDAKIETVCLRHSPLRQSGLSLGRHALSLLNPLNSLAHAITESGSELVIPCDDLMAEMLWLLGRTKPEFMPLIERSCGNPDAFAVRSSRSDFLREAAAAGVAIADTIALERASDLDRSIARFGLPLVIKADGSWGGDGVVIAENRATAETALTKFSRISRLRAIASAMKRRQPHLLLRAHFSIAPGPSAQRFVVGRPATSSIVCWGGKLLAANHFDVLVSNGTGPATVLEISHDPAMTEAAGRIAARFGLSGFYGLDYMRGQDGAALLLEINPRATPTAHLALGPDHDLAAALLTAAGHSVPDRPAVTRQSRIALFPQEWRRDPHSPHLDTAFHDLPQADQPLALALGWQVDALTSFSSSFPGLSGLKKAGGESGR